MCFSAEKEEPVSGKCRLVFTLKHFDCKYFFLWWRWNDANLLPFILPLAAAPSPADGASSSTDWIRNLSTTKKKTRCSFHPRTLTKRPNVSRPASDHVTSHLCEIALKAPSSVSLRHIRVGGRDGLRESLHLFLSQPRSQKTQRWLRTLSCHSAGSPLEKQTKCWGKV